MKKFEVEYSARHTFNAVKKVRMIEAQSAVEAEKKIDKNRYLVTFVTERHPQEDIS